MASFTASGAVPSSRWPVAAAAKEICGSADPNVIVKDEKIRAFIRDKIIPLEGDGRQTHHGPTEEFRRELVALAAAEGLVAAVRNCCPAICCWPSSVNGAAKLLIVLNG